MTVEHYRLLFEHNAWANNRVVEQIANMGEAASRPTGLDLGEGSVIETLVHILSAELAWFARCQGEDEFPCRWCPRQDSNLRPRLRRAVLYPLSYGGSATSKGYQPGRV